MKIWLLVLIATSSLFGQAVRIEPSFGYALPLAPTPGAARLLGTNPGSKVYLCTNPTIPCPTANLAVTYTDVTQATTCPAAAQATVHNSPTCSSVFGSDGSFGWWVPSPSGPTTYWYSFILPTSQQATINGPYPISVGGSGGSGGSGVSSFNLRNGAVTLQTGDVTALGDLTNNTSGNALTATRLAATPTLCPTGQAPTGVTTAGNAVGCQALATAGVTTFNGRTGAVSLTLGDVTALGTLSNSTSGTAAFAGALTTAPTFTQGANIIITGTWPNLTFAASGGGTTIPATYYATGATTGQIAAAAASCGATVNCQVIPVPNYTQTDTPFSYGFSTDPHNPANSLYAKTISFFDNRYGGLLITSQADGYFQSQQKTLVAIQQTLIGPNTTYTYNPLSSILNAANGGSNYCDLTLAGSPCVKGTFQPSTNTVNKWTPGQGILFGGTITSQSPGDSIIGAFYNYCYGGFTSKSDEGCHWLDLQDIQGPVEYAGATVTTGANPTSVSIPSPTQGDIDHNSLGMTAGAQRFLFNMTSGILSGNATAFSSAGNNVSIMTDSTASFPASSYGTLGSSITAAGLVTITPTMTVGAVSSLTTSTVVCIGDSDTFECGLPSNITSTTFQFQATTIHNNVGANYVAWGGLTGRGWHPVADDVTSAAQPDDISPVIGTLHVGWPILYSTATTVAIWINGGSGGWGQYAGQFCVGGGCVSSQPAYTINQMAEVSSVYNASTGGVTSNVLQLYANTLNLNYGDTLQEFIYPLAYMSNGNWVNEAHTPDQGGFGLTFRGPFWGNSTMMDLWRDAPDSTFQYGGGNLPSPYFGIHFHGARQNYGILFERSSLGANIAIGCDTSPCTTSSANIPIIQAALVTSGGDGYDDIWHDPINKRWIWGVNFNASFYTASATAFTMPFGTITGFTGNSTLVAHSSATAFAASAGAVCTDANSNLTTTGCTGGGGGGGYPLGSGLGVSITGSSSYVANRTVAPRTVTATTDTLLATDCGGVVTYAAGSSAVAVAIPQAGLGGNFLNGCPIKLRNYGSGTVTLTPSTSTINHGAASYSLAAGASTEIISNTAPSPTVYEVSSVSAAGGGTGTITGVTAGTGLTGGGTSGTVTIGLTTPVSVANGGTGTASPGIVAGTNVTVTGTWPNQTINAATGTQTIANGTATLGTASIASAACATAVTVSGTGIATTDNIMADFNADPTSTTGYSPSASGMLTIIKYPTANNVNFKVCNNTASSITPGAATLNWRVVR